MFHESNRRNATCAPRHPSPNYYHRKLILLLHNKNVPEYVRSWDANLMKQATTLYAHQLFVTKMGVIYYKSNH